MKKLLYVLLAVLLLSSCATAPTIPFKVEVPEIPLMDQEFSSENIKTEIASVDDIVSNLLIYEGQLMYYKSVSDTLYDYIYSLKTLTDEMDG